MATLNQIFSKQIDRPIDGVIKADDETSLRAELEEYVITAEIGQRIEHFLDAYNNYTNANGVWISGFFGSGKSHLLKMLAVLLENRQIDGTTAYDLFRDKDELTQNPMLAGALRKAISTPSRSILFNIDQKADVISKTDVDALLSVFQKVFDEACGYYGKQPHIAQFERDLDGRGRLVVFKEAYARIAGKEWERGREQALLERSNIAKAFAEAMQEPEDPGVDVLGQYRRDTRVSIEDFANTVKAWIDNQAPGFRLNFFVDEVGQYIAEHVKLMTNLQTVAETLNTKCSGQAWIIVTAQQDMTSIIGDRSSWQEYDFSKIMARFATKMPLNSADVAEVIQRRLLEKTDAGEVMLANLYDSEEHNLRTLYEFTDGSLRLKSFRDRDHFVATYPFPPYQYDLFQLSISELSQHNAFEGKHSSVGERSMLGVFQTVAKFIAGMEVGAMASFDMMFEGIRTALKSSVQQSIHLAERNLDDPMAVRVLKALFLVKYVKGFKPTIRNIAILLMQDPNADQVTERRLIEQALSVLERNTLIQSNGDSSYEFLTNEEKDVEDEIKATEIDQSEIEKDLENLVFEEVLKQRKIKYAGTGHEYPFARKLDGNLSGREYELGVNVLSPFGPDRTLDAVRMTSMTTEDVVVLMPDDERLLRDLTLYRKTYKFVRQAKLGSEQPSRDRIIDEKGEQNGRRYRDIEARLRRLLASAHILVRGDDLDIGGEAQDRVISAFQTLVEKVYVNLPMLRNATYTEADIATAASPENSLFSGDDDGLTEAEQAILNYVQSQDRTGVRVSAKSLIESFTNKPYGWPTPAVLCLAASIAARGKVEVRLNSDTIEGADLAKALPNTQLQANILFSPQPDFTPAQVRTLKKLYADMFNRPLDSNDARVIGAAWAKGLSELQAEIEGLLGRETNYPFVAALEPLKETLASVADQQPAWYVIELPGYEDALLDPKEDVLDLIRGFMAGPQKKIYDDIRVFFEKHDANFQYVGFAEAAKIRETMSEPDCYKGSAILDLKASFADLKTTVELQILEERKAVVAAVDDCIEQVEQLGEFRELPDENRKLVLAHLAKYKADLDDVHLIAVLRDRGANARTRILKDVMAEIGRLRVPKDKSPGMDEPPTPPIVPEIYVTGSDLFVKWSKPFLSTETDVEDYFEQNKKRFLAEIKSGRKVIV